MQKVLRKILCPNKIIGFLVFNISFMLLFYVFLNHLDYTPLAYVSYLLSFYSLVIFCIWFYKVCRVSNDFIKKSRVYKYYLSNTLLLAKTSIYFSFFFNLLFGVFELCIGVYYKSWWFITFAIYYLLLCFMRISLLRSIDSRHDEKKKLKYTGILLLFLNLILTGMIILILKTDQVISYHGYLIYLISLYDFYLIISAIISVIKYRKVNSPIILSSKCINLTVAMIAMVSLEAAMIYQFGDNDTNFKSLMSASTGLAICLINSFIAIFMILKSNNRIYNSK